MRDLGRVFMALAGGLDAGGSLLLLTDYDGTLTHLVPNPSEADLPREVRDDLRLLARAPRVRVGVLSGRSLDDVRERVGVAELIYAGCHGLEVQGPGVTFRHPDAETRRPMMDGIARDLRRRCLSMPGVRVEPKGLSVAVHHRGASSRAVARMVSELEGVTRQAERAVKLLRGKNVVDILPGVRWNKGECALWLRDRLAPRLASPVLTLYMGDDRTDELVFDVLSGTALTVRVGPGRTMSAAGYRFPDVAEVHRLLSALAAEIQQRREGP